MHSTVGGGEGPLVHDLEAYWQGLATHITWRSHGVVGKDSLHAEAGQPAVLSVHLPAPDVGQI